MASLDAPLDVESDDGDDELCLGDVIADRRDDPGSRAVREIDWSEFMAGLSADQQQVVMETAAGFGTKTQAAIRGVSPSAISQQKRTVARQARGFWGETVLQDAGEKPVWQRSRHR